MVDRPPPVRIDDPSEADLPGSWSVRDGFDLPDHPWDLSDRRWVCQGRVTDAASASAALLALARGVGLDVDVSLDPGRRQRFVEDASKAGDTAGFATAERTLDTLGADHRALLDALAAGGTVTDAAGLLHLSRRTANRRLSEARALLGAASTADAVRRWVELRPT